MRTFVSTREATIVEVLALPSSAGRNRCGPPSTPQPPRGCVEEVETLLYGQRLLAARGLDANHLSSRHELDPIPRTDSMPLCDRLRDRDLKLACYLRHDLTLARMKSLFKWPGYGWDNRASRGVAQR